MTPVAFHHAPRTGPTCHAGALSTVVLRRRGRAGAGHTDAPAWRRRLDAARAIAATATTTWLGDDAFDEIERVVAQAHDDLARLDLAIARLDPERTTRELKDALRAHTPGMAPDHDPVLTARRNRFGALQDLQDRREQMASEVEATLIDVETLAARAVQASLGATRLDDLRLETDHLRLRVAALSAAHDEIQRW